LLFIKTFEITNNAEKTRFGIDRPKLEFFEVIGWNETGVLKNSRIGKLEIILVLQLVWVPDCVL